MNKVKKIFVAFVLFGLVGCATLPPPKPLDPQRAVIGISMKMPRKGIFTHKADMIYLTKVDEEEDLYTQSYFIRSNYVKDGRAYFLNLKPGRYAAVAMGHTTGNLKHTTLFPKKLIKLTQVLVAAGTMEFMGEYIVRGSLGLESADDAQLHYAKLIVPGVKVQPSGATKLLTLFSGVWFYEGSFDEVKRDKQAETQFLTNALEDLKDTGWINIIQKRMGDLKADK